MTTNQQTLTEFIINPKTGKKVKRDGKIGKQILLETALSLKPDFILSLDADEVISKEGNNSLQALCKLCIEKDLDGLEFQLINLWRSTNWKRLDSLYNEGWSVRLWRAKSDMSFDIY
jgi:hypothetical protein